MNARSPTFSRRHLLQSAAAAIPTIISASAIGRERPGPNDRINLGLIGFGARGEQVLKDFLKLPDAQVVAICDVQKLHYRELNPGEGPALGRDAGKQMVESHYAAAKTSGAFTGCQTYSDFRELCAQKDLDAIIVTSPDHWHALHALEALKS